MKDFQLLIYSTPTEDMKVDVVLKDENIWATQKAMAALFGVQIPDISKHINNVFDAGELSRSTTVSKMETVVQGGFRGQPYTGQQMFKMMASPLRWSMPSLSHSVSS